MSDKISELYSKYTGALDPALEGNGYYDYLLSLIKSGRNVLSLNSQILHKLVDEEWLLRVEDALDALYRITGEPRRFVTTAENVVPVELAKKITADSVRHLSQNTQFITPTDDGSIRPTKILNITVEDTYNLYENRFLYHLILRLYAFVEQRCEAILANLGDETTNVFSWDGRVEDGAEIVEMKLEMKLHNKEQADVGNIEDTEIYKRLDRVRRLVGNLKRGNFCDIMKGCTRVRNPIQRTNLMIKDKSYRKCYDLWYFLDAYDKQGYMIEVENKSMQYSEDYLERLYQNFIGTYSIFKSVLEPDSRDLTAELNRRLKFIKPRFITKLKEERVESRDLDDVEIRRVFVDEVTPAQLEAEEKLAEEIERRKQLELDLAAALERAEKAEAELAAALEEAERAAKEAARVLEETKAAAAKELAETKEAAARELAETKENAARELAKTKENAARELAETKAEAERVLTETKESAAKELAETKESAAHELAETKENAARELAETKAAADDKFNAAMAAADKRFEESKAHARKQLQEMKDSSERNMLHVRKEADAVKEKAAKAVEEKEAQLVALRLDATRRMDAQAAQTEEYVAGLKESHARELEAATAYAKRQAADAKEKYVAALEMEQNAKKLNAQAGKLKAAAEKESSEASELVAAANKSKRWAEHAYADLAEQLVNEQKLRKSIEDELARTREELEEAKNASGFLGLFRRR